MNSLIVKLIAGCSLMITSATFAANARVWIPLQTPDNPIAIDYASVDLKSEKISLDLRQKFSKPQGDGVTNYTELIHHYAVDCDSGALIRLSTKIRDEHAAREEGPDVQAPAGTDRIAIGQLKTFCILHSHHLNLPDISLNGGTWEEMESPVSTMKIAEATQRRQKSDGIVLLSIRNEFEPLKTADGVTWRYFFGSALYECEKQDAHTLISVRYDAAGKLISGMFYGEQSALPKLDSNRERFAAACK